MSLDCKQGIEYRCPYIEECIATKGNIDVLRGEGEMKKIDTTKLKYFVDGLIGEDKDRKTWADEWGIYSCNPIKEQGSN